ncbi:hypothetical protein ACFX1S_043882 [Malus domestica]
MSLMLCQSPRSPSVAIWLVSLSSLFQEELSYLYVFFAYCRVKCCSPIVLGQCYITVILDNVFKQLQVVLLNSRTSKISHIARIYLRSIVQEKFNQRLMLP